MTNAVIKIADTYIDFDAETQEAAIRKIVDILHANRVDAFPGHFPPHTKLARANIRAALDSYRAAVVALVMADTLNIDQGDDLMKIVDKVMAEQEA